MMLSVALTYCFLFFGESTKVDASCPPPCLCFGNNINCRNKGLTAIPKVPNTTALLDLYGNNITNIDADVLSGLVNLVGLFLFNNQITNIEAGVFAGLINLEWMSLQNNQITSIEADAFAGLINLKSLFIDNNQITNIETGAFSGLVNLNWLYLYSNDIKIIPAEIFTNLTTLTRLWLNDNPTLCCNMLETIELGKNFLFDNFRLTCNDFNESMSYTSFNSSLCQSCDGEGGMCVHRRKHCKALITTQKCQKCNYKCCKR